VDIDGAVDMASTLKVGSTITINDPVQTTFGLVSKVKSVYLSSTDATYANLTIRKEAATSTDYLQIRDSGNDLLANLTSLGGLITAPTAGGHAVFNEGGVDADFRVESSGNANMFYVDGGNNRVGIGTGVAPHQKLTVTGASGEVDGVLENGILALTTGTGVIADTRLLMGIVDDDYAWLQAADYGVAYRDIVLNPNGGYVGIGETAPTHALTVKSSGVLGKFEAVDQAAELRIESPTVNVIGLYTGTLDALTFGTASTERVRIDASGAVLVSKTAQNSTVVGVQLNETGAIIGTVDGGQCLLLNRKSTTGTIIEFQYNNTGVGSVSVTGSATAYNTSSDYRLKTDAQPMVGASDRVLALKPVNFAWISSGERVDGFLAHEAQEIVPEAVHGTKDAMRDEEYEVTAAVEATYDEDGNELTAAVEAVMGTRSVPDYQGIDQSKLVPLLTAALQEALNKIDAMEIRLAALEA
jgi:hypothetical protein